MTLKRYIKPTFLLLYIFLWGLFINTSYSEPTLIIGDDEDTLSILIHTKYLDGTPVLLFASQNDSALITPNLLNSIDNYVFADANLKKEKRSFSSSLIKRINEPQTELTYIFKKRSGSFFLPFSSTYFVMISVVPSTVGQPIGTEKFSKIPYNNNIIRIDNEVFGINDFVDNHEQEGENRNILKKVIRLDQGTHHYEFLKNHFFDFQWIIIEPQAKLQSSKPEEKKSFITFHRLNPTKYLINIRQAKGPFWLVFSETYHPSWMIYKASLKDLQNTGLPHAVTEYKNIAVNEISAEAQFLPKDIKYLFSKPLPIPHFQVNNYANGWYIDPKDIGAGADFDLVLYFYPQSLFYLGFFITLLTLLMCCLWQGYVFFRNIFKDQKNAKIL